MFVLPYIQENIMFDEQAALSIATSGGFTFWDEENQSACVQVKRGVDDANISQIDILFSVGGESHRGALFGHEIPNLNEMVTKCFNLSEYGRPDHVDLVPIYLTGGTEKEGTAIPGVPISDDGNSEDLVISTLDEASDCGDGADNDNDGLIDLEDPGCINSSDISEVLVDAEWETFSISELQEKFDEVFFGKYPTGIIATSPYALSHYLAGLISMYEATQDEAYLEYALANVENLNSNLVDVDGDGYREWTYESNYDHDDNLSTVNRTYCLHTERSLKQFARLIRIIKNGDSLNDIYGVRADAALDIIKHDMINNPECSYRFEPGYSMVHHLVSHSTAVLLELYLIEGNVDYLGDEAVGYLDALNVRANALRNSLFPHPEDSRAVAWGQTACIDLNYSDYCYIVRGAGSSRIICKDSLGTNYCSPSDVSHGESFVFTAIELHRAGIVFTREDIDALRYTFMNRIWDQNISDPKYRDFVDGSLELPIGTVTPGGTVGEENVYGQYHMGSNLAPGWIGLGAFDAGLQRIFEQGEKSEVTLRAMLNEMAFYAEMARNKVAGDCVYTNSAKEICDEKDNDCDGIVDENLGC